MMTNQPVALITGASRGIGRALALGLADLGHRIILTGRSRERLDPVARLIAARTGDRPDDLPRVVCLDLNRPDTVDRILGPVLQECGRLDVLVNNAGQWRGGTLDLDLEAWADLLRVNVLGQVAVLQTVVPWMKRQGAGHVFNVASRAGTVGFAQSGAYCASKFALVGLTESLTRELAGCGIKVTALCPGWVDTDMAVEAGSRLRSDEMIRPEDLMETVRWLLSLSPTATVKRVVLECPASLA